MMARLSLPLSLRPRIGLVLALATLVMGADLASEIFAGLTPCALCLKQRAPYYLSLPLLALAYFYTPYAKLASRGLLMTVGLVFLASAGLGIYHAGIEYGFWAGPATCGGGGAMASSPEALLAALENQSIVRCDAPAWTLFGISLAGYNALASLALAALCLGALRHPEEEK